MSSGSPAVLVTGAASGIGRAIASRLVAEGASVPAVDVSPDLDGPGIPFTADLGARDGNTAAVETARHEFGRLDAVIANAGFQHVASIEDFPKERWDALLAVLLTSPFLLAKHSWSSLVSSGRGRFIVIASIHGLVASPFKAGYVSAKHGVLGHRFTHRLGQRLARELAGCSLVLVPTSVESSGEMRRSAFRARICTSVVTRLDIFVVRQMEPVRKAPALEKGGFAARRVCTRDRLWRTP